MMGTGEPQTLAPQLDSLELVRLLRRRLAGEPFPHSFIHEVDACSAAPEELVRGHAPGADQGDGKGIAWYFCSPANCHESAGGGSAWRRRRQVGGAGTGRRCWHPETGKKPILGPQKKSVGAYKRTLSYVLKIKNPPGAPKPYRNKRLGWCMIEIGLEEDDGANQQLVLCKVYKSPRMGTETSIEASSTGAEDIGPVAISGGRVTQDESLDVPGGNIPAPPPASCDSALAGRGNPDLSIGIGPAPKYGTLCLPAGEVPIISRVSGGDRPPTATVHKGGPGPGPFLATPVSRVAIVKKADVAAVARDGKKAVSVTVVMKFGRSSMPSAERMKEMAKLVISFPAVAGEIVAVVLSDMWNITPNILLAVWKALRCGDQRASEIHEFAIIKELYLRTIDELGLDKSTVSGPLDKLEHHLQHVAMTKELTPRTRDYLVSFCDRTSTEMFSDYLNKLGKGTLQEWELRAVTTSGRGSSDMAAATIARALESREIQVWKDVDGIFTCDPKVCAKAILVPYLTFDEAAELGYFGEQSMQLAMEAGISVIVNNPYNPQAPGTVITKTRDMSKSTLTSIVLKSNITMLDIERISMLSQNAFVAKAFSIFQEFEDMVIFPNYAAEGKMSLTLVPSKLLSQEVIQQELDNVVEEFKKNAAVDLRQHRSVISLIGNAQMAALILQKALNVLGSIKVEAQKVSQWSSKLVTKISLVVDDSEAELCVQALHFAFFELNDDYPSVRVNSSVAASTSRSGVKKRKAAGDDHPEGRADNIADPSTSSADSTMPVEEDSEIEDDCFSKRLDVNYMMELASGMCMELPLDLYT